MWSCLDRYKLPPLLFRVWCSSVPPIYPAICRTQLIYQAAELNFKIQEAASSTSPESSQQDWMTLDRLLEEAQALDRKLEAFRSTYLAPVTSVQSIEDYPCPKWFKDIVKRPGAPTEFPIYETFGDANGSNLCCCTRITLQQSILQCINVIQTNRPYAISELSLRDKSEHAIEAMVDTILATTFSHLCATKDDERKSQPISDVSITRAHCILGSCRVSGAPASRRPAVRRSKATFKSSTSFLPIISSLIICTLTHLARWCSQRKLLYLPRTPVDWQTING